MNNTESVEITLDYLNSNKTKKGGYTKKQVLALGLRWPLVSGWKQELVGTVLNYEQANEFEQAGRDGKKQKDKQVKTKLTIEGCLEYLFTHSKKLDANHIVRLRNIETKYMETRKRTK